MEGYNADVGQKHKKEKNNQETCKTEQRGNTKRKNEDNKKEERKTEREKKEAKTSWMLDQTVLSKIRLLSTKAKNKQKQHVWEEEGREE